MSVAPTLPEEEVWPAGMSRSCCAAGISGERVEIVHIQSDARTVVGSLEAAIVWLRVDTNYRLASDGPVVPDVYEGSIPKVCPSES